MSNGVRTICQLALAGLFVVESAGLASAQSPPLWGKLSPGSYGVGFRTVWQLDYSRRYNTTFGDKTTYAMGKAPRPILINIWYPTKAAGNGKTMRHRDYLDVRSADRRCQIPRLADYELGSTPRSFRANPARGPIGETAYWTNC